MVDFSLSSSAGRPGREDVLVLAFHAGGQPAPGTAEAAARVGIDLASLRRLPSFTGAVGEHAQLATSPVGVVALGVGDAAGSVDQVRAAAMHAARRLRGYRGVTTTLAQVGPDRAASVRALVEGFLLGSYDSPRSGVTSRRAHEVPATWVKVVVEAPASRQAGVRRAVERGAVAGETATWVRTLVETPAGSLIPEQLAEAFRTAAGAAGVSASVWTRRQLVDRGFGGVIGVGQGSSNGPRVVELRWGDDGRRPLGLTGKGITFDSGGINIKKDAGEIAWMKADMAGAAAVVGAVVAAGRLGIATPVRAIVPIAENMPGGRAIRPGDVLTHPGGRTSEVTDTDCEGRLVLADAIAYLFPSQGRGDRRRRHPDRRRRCRARALGGVRHRRDAGSLLAAGATAGEPGWALPLVPSYVKLMTSPVADIANCPKGAPDSAILAATYLRTFAGDVPWVHIDNGSSAYLERAADGWPEGATGSPMRALLQLLEDRAGAR